MATTEPPDQDSEVDQPGLGHLREAVANHTWRQLPRAASIRRDALAGLNNAVSSVPDGMASGILAGVNPIYGLYACIAGPIVGAIFSSTQLMVVATTSASAIAAGQALITVPLEERANALFVLVIFIGLFQVLFGVLRLGRFTRFVSFSVMTGFIAGIAVLTIIAQLPAATGYTPEGGNRLTQTLDLLAHAAEFHFPSLGLTALALGLALVLPRTPLGKLGLLAAIVVPSLLVPAFALVDVQLVRDVGEVPGGLPMPFLPSLSDFTVDAFTAAPAIAAIIVVQGAGVSQSVPNPDGSRQSMSRDFIAQGAANVTSGFFRGLPVGASLGATALSVVSGAGSRWAAIFAGTWIALILLVVPDLVSRIAMPTLAALLIVASASTIKPAEAHSLWRTGLAPRVAALTTFLSTIFLPIQAAVAIGMALSALVHVYASAADISVVELVERPDGEIEERSPSRTLASHRATVLDVYGHLFYAGARTLERSLPEPRGAESPVVILRLRGRTTVGATLVEVLSNYADRLRDAGGRLYLTGVGHDVYEQMVDTGKLRRTVPLRAYEATPVVFESTRRAYQDASTWLLDSANEEETAQADAGPEGPNRTAEGDR